MTNQLTVYTSRYSNKNLAGSGLVCVGISAYWPRFKLTFKLSLNLRVLAPTPAMLAKARSGQLTQRQFRAEYERLLDRIGADHILRSLRHLQGDAPGLALLCYEDVIQGETCHRRMLAGWLKRKAGIDVPELPPPGGSVPRPRPSKRSQLDLFPRKEVP